MTSAQIEVVARAVKSDATESELSEVSALESALVSTSASTSVVASPPHDARNKPIAAKPARYRRFPWTRLRIILIMVTWRHQHRNPITSPRGRPLIGFSVGHLRASTLDDLSRSLLADDCAREGARSRRSERQRQNNSSPRAGWNSQTHRRRDERISPGIIRCPRPNSPCVDAYFGR